MPTKLLATLACLLSLSFQLNPTASAQSAASWIGIWSPNDGMCPPGCCCMNTPLYISASPNGAANSVVLATSVNGSTSCLANGGLGSSQACTIFENTVICPAPPQTNFGIVTCAINDNILNCDFSPESSTCPTSAKLVKMNQNPPFADQGTTDWDGLWTGLPTCSANSCCCFTNPIAITGNAPTELSFDGPITGTITVTANLTASTVNACFGLPTFTTQCTVDPFVGAICHLPFSSNELRLSLYESQLTVEEIGAVSCLSVSSATLVPYTLPSSGHKLSGGAIFGIIFSIFVVIGFALFLVFYRRRMRRMTPSVDFGEPLQPYTSFDAGRG